MALPRQAAQAYKRAAMFQQIGKVVLFAGLVMTAFGGLLYLLGRLGLGRLGGDVSFGGKNWRVYLPIGTCVLLSILLTLILYVLGRLRR